MGAKSPIPRGRPPLRLEERTVAPGGVGLDRVDNPHILRAAASAALAHCIPPSLSTPSCRSYRGPSDGDGRERTALRPASALALSSSPTCARICHELSAFPWFGFSRALDPADLLSPGGGPASRALGLGKGRTDARGLKRALSRSSRGLASP